jgi:GT2 family glycosyltransferase
MKAIRPISIITPVWNRGDLTNRFLSQHWALYAGWPGIEWIIIDNGSTDETGETLSIWKHTMGEQLQHISLAENSGFGPGNNRGAEIAKGEILVFLSNDVQVLGDYLTPIWRALAEEEKALYGPEIWRHNTGWNTFEPVGTIPYVAGWCVIAGRAFWQRVGPWDERFVPCDYEDMDLSYTVQRLDYPLIELPLPLKHDSGKSAESLPDGRLKVTLANRDRFTAKWGLVQG